MRYSLGLDIGSESVGWSVVSLDDADNPTSIVRMGVRTFDAVRREGASATTPAEERRLARGQRRRIRNRKRRIDRVVDLFVQAGLITSRSEIQNILATRPDDLSSWALRVQALDRMLSERDWVRVLFHIARHRGFKSTKRGEIVGSSEDDKKEAAKLGKMLSGMQAIHDGWKSHGYRTVAEYIESPDWPFPAQHRNKGGSYACTISRADLLDEIHMLFERQRELGNPFASETVEDRYAEIVDEPPRLTEGEELIKKVGHCFLEPEERRAPKATLTAQRFIALQKLNNQTLIGKDGDEKPLDAEQTAILLHEAATVEKLTYKRAIKALGLLDSGYLFRAKKKQRKDTLEETQKETLLTFPAYHEMRKTLEAEHPAAWEALRDNPDLYDRVASVLTYYLRPESATEKLLELGLDDDVAALLADKVVYSGHAHLSLKVMRDLIPLMEKPCGLQGQEGRGLRYDEACKEAGYDHSQRSASSEARSQIPPLDELPDFMSITNPNVRRAISQTRKVVNTIIREHGTPQRVAVELAREAAAGPQQKREDEKRQKENRKAKEERFQRIKEIVPEIPDKELKKASIKQLLYEQQGGKCAYSLKPLDYERVIKDPTYAEIDHVIPRSVCFDDSMANKVLVLTSENRDKGNEFAAVYVKRAHGVEHFARYEAWVAGTQLPPRKRRQLLTEELSADQRKEMQGRYLTSTQFAARYFLGLAKQYLGAPVVLATNGRMTSDYRWLLGLEPKDREANDRHHAVDATLIAIADHGAVQRMARYFQRRAEVYRTPDNSWIDANGVVVEKPAVAPWPSFREDVEAQEKDVFVSRMPNRRISGRGHEETIYSLRHVRKEAADLPSHGKIALPAGAEARPTKRVTLAALSPSQISDILKEPSPVLVDEAANHRLYDLVRARLRATENGSKDRAKQAFGNPNDPLRMPSNSDQAGPIVRHIRLYTDVRSGIAVRHGIAKNDTIVRLDFYKKPDKRNRPRHFVVPVYAADLAMGWVPNRAAVKDHPEQEWPVIDDSYEFMFSLYRGDCFRVWKTEQDDPPYLYMTSFNRDSMQIKGNMPDRSNRAESGKVEPIRPAVTTAFRIEKYEVDILGTPHPVHHEPRPAVGHS